MKSKRKPKKKRMTWSRRKRLLIIWISIGLITLLNIFFLCLLLSAPPYVETFWTNTAIVKTNEAIGLTLEADPNFTPPPANAK